MNLFYKREKRGKGKVPGSPGSPSRRGLNQNLPTHAHFIFTRKGPKIFYPGLLI